MASIFTYEPDIPRVSSPWLKQLESVKPNGNLQNFEHSVTKTDPTLCLDGTGKVLRLEAEPQEGPVEYKLHLLLRSRRNYTAMSTVIQISGSRHSKYNGPARIPSETILPATIPSPALTQQTRQHRLEQLTTQLLWRLQQSSPHHASSATNVVLPHLPESTTELQAPPQPAKLLHGLEESQGALYEIGVSDDGTLVGLAQDEMQDSLNNLRAMAASLGCIVEVQRMVQVGDCSWSEDSNGKDVIQHHDNLFVAEALVKPNLVSDQEAESTNSEADVAEELPMERKPAKQLRISLTGATMSGKSSLLGALSTTTLDNGRGKSRLSMLKHRHEITSGVTSSVTQELIGYCDKPDGSVEVVNYATESVTSWIDIHAASANSRLVFISDSAGHPRYRRTTVRGLIGWNPHWVLLCIPADDEGESSGKVGSTPPSCEVLGPAAGDVDLSGAHLDLCLRLHLPLVVVITKLDLASKTGLRATLAKLLSTLKAACRKPVLIPNSPGNIADEELQTFAEKKLTDMRKILSSLSDEPCSAVPIIMTSAVQGAGFDNLHAILHELTIPERSEEQADHSAHSVFHIEDRYSKASESKSIIVSGHSQRGTLSVGSELFLGPCTSSVIEDSEDSDTQHRPRLSGILPTSRSFPGALRAPHHLFPRSSNADQEWRRVKIMSIRNLRLPVTSLLADQAGTIGLELVDDNNIDAWGAIKIRRGMVLCDKPISPTSTLVAQFRREDLGSLAVGSHVVLYLASVRSSARILSCSTAEPTGSTAKDIPGPDRINTSEYSRDGEYSYSPTAGAVTHHLLHVTFSFDASKEHVEVGTKVLVMPGGGPGLFGGTERGEKGVAGLEGFVGSVVKTLG